MTVLKTNNNQLKIKLTDTEVLTLFGSYNQLFSLKKDTKILISFLLQDIIAEHKADFKNGKISADLKVIKNFGCEIILYCRQDESLPTENSSFRFNSFENLTKAAKLITQKWNKAEIKSSVYNYDGFYYLLTDNKSRIFIANDFYDYESGSFVFAEKIKEYGKPVITENAIKALSEVFN